jgi:mono/diheme cytochrome c family protein
MKNNLLVFGSLALVMSVGLPLTAADGDAKKGEAVFNDNCAACHSTGTDQLVGPGLKGLFKKEKLVTGKPADEANVRSIIEDGTSGGMPPMGGGMKPEEKDNLIAYLKTL